VNAGSDTLHFASAQLLHNLLTKSKKNSVGITFNDCELKKKNIIDTDAKLKNENDISEFIQKFNKSSKFHEA
jgi:hypothetical protein